MPYKSWVIDWVTAKGGVKELLGIEIKTNTNSLLSSVSNLNS